MCNQHAPALINRQELHLLPHENPQLSRKKLWELDHSCHCSVIGTCLTLAELRQIARKADVSNPAAIGDYDLHRLFVSSARTAAHVSRLVQKHLERKYKPTIQQLAKIPPDALRAFWKAALDSGEIAAAYWALLTSPTTPYSLLDEIHGDVHMLSHLSGATVRVDLQEMKGLRYRNRELEQQLADSQLSARHRLAEQQRTIEKLNRRLTDTVDTERELNETRAQLNALTADPLTVRLRAELQALSHQLGEHQARAESAATAATHWRQQAAQDAAHNQQLEQQLAALRQERDTLESTLASVLSVADSTDGSLVKTTASTDLCGRCVLYVGGRQNLCTHFRELVERCNGRFIHHDGGQEDGRAQLWDVLQQADAVLCPLDCVSHDAVQRVKRFCKRSTKPLVLLPRASLSAFTSGLNAVVS